MDENLNLPPLPRPTVKYLTNLDDINEATARGMMSNPVYVGVPPYRRIVSDEAWVRAALELIKEEGVEQFLVNMLHMLRMSLVDAIPAEAIPEDYDGPWPDGNQPPTNRFDYDYDEDEDEDEEDDKDSPWQHPLEGYIYCSHDDFPMILIDDEFVCVTEYLYSHLNEAPVNDLVNEPVLSLVFQNGHTLPLLCPDCGESLHIADQNDLLDTLNGLTVVDIDWDEEDEELILAFGEPGTSPDDEDFEPLTALSVHLNSVRQLTCPFNHLWHEDDEDDEDNDDEVLF